MFDVTAITLNKETIIPVCDRVSQFLNLKVNIYILYSACKTCVGLGEILHNPFLHEHLPLAGESACI